jgi:tetratricopeptide (TPR) repeat protein
MVYLNGRVNMQASANSNPILTDLSSFKWLAGLQKDFRQSAFYRKVLSELIRGVYRKQSFSELGNSLVTLADHAYGLRQIDTFEKASDFLLNLPLGAEYESIGRYYQALCIYQRGASADARVLLEQMAGTLPIRFREKARLAISVICYESGDLQSFSMLNLDASRVAVSSDWRDPQTFVNAQRNLAVLKSVDGDHRGALADFERLFPLSRALGRWRPYLYYDYINSLAVELMEVGRLEEARNAAKIALASPFAGAFPQWRETSDDIELRRRRASRSVVAFHRATADAAFNREAPEANDPSRVPVPELSDSLAAGPSLTSPPPPEVNNLLRLPVPDRSESLAAKPSSASRPARVFSLQAWRKRMPNVSTGDPQDETTPRPTTHQEKQAAVKKLQTLTTREMLLRIMNMIGDERVGDGLLLRALIILEELETDNNQRS